MKHHADSAVGAADTPPSPAPDRGGVERLIEQIREAIRAAWLLCDNTEEGESGLPIVERDDWDRLSAELERLEALIPEHEQPASAGHAATMVLSVLTSLQQTLEERTAERDEWRSRANSAEKEAAHWRSEAEEEQKNAAVFCRRAVRAEARIQPLEAENASLNQYIQGCERRILALKEALEEIADNAMDNITERRARLALTGKQENMEEGR